MAFFKQQDIKFIPIDYKELPSNIAYDKKKHDTIVKRAGALSKELDKLGYNVDIIKVGDEVSADGQIPILTNQKFPPMYKEFNNFLILPSYQTHNLNTRVGDLCVRFST